MTTPPPVTPRKKGRRNRILNKLYVCTCGCGGSDPWHKSWYWRVVTEKSATEGTVKMPYSTKPVRVTREPGDPYWTVDRGSIVYDK